MRAGRPRPRLPLALLPLAAPALPFPFGMIACRAAGRLAWGSDAAAAAIAMAWPAACRMAACCMEERPLLLAAAIAAAMAGFNPYGGRSRGLELAAAAAAALPGPPLPPVVPPGPCCLPVWLATAAMAACI